MAVNRRYIDAPDGPILPFGIFSVASPTLDSDPHWQLGVEYESDNCASTNVAPDPCVITGTNEVQTATITGAPTGGSYTLTFWGFTTAPIVYNAAPAVVQAALEALPNVEPGDITVGGTASALTFTFGGQWAAENVPQITATGSFTGGTAPAIATGTTTGGVRTGTKTVTAGGGVLTFDPFSLYTIRGCSGPADFQRAVARATRGFNAAEQRGVEASLWARWTAVGAGVVDVGSTAVDPVQGFALAEYWAAQNYGLAPVMHMPRDLASVLATKNVIERHGNKMESHLGSTVVAGGGYSKTGREGAAPVAGQAWIFITGKTTVRRSKLDSKGPFLVQSPLDNTHYSMVERTYVADTDCLLGAIRVNMA